MSTNLPLYTLNGTAVTARASEVPAATFDNYGSCSGVIGQNTGNFEPKDTDFSRIADTAAHPTQHIGGNGLGAGTATDFPIQVIDGADINNTVAFVVTIGAVAPDAVLDVTTGAVNRTGQTVPLGDWAWGVIPVA